MAGFISIPNDKNEFSLTASGCDFAVFLNDPDMVWTLNLQIKLLNHVLFHLLEYRGIDKLDFEGLIGLFGEHNYTHWLPVALTNGWITEDPDETIHVTELGLAIWKELKEYDKVPDRRQVCEELLDL